MPRMHTVRTRAIQLGFWLIAAAGTAALFAVVSHHVLRMDFRPLAALCLPVLAGFFAFTSLLFLRGRSLAPGRDQARTMFAAEQAMQGTLSYLAGVLLGASFYGLLRALDFSFDPRQPTAAGFWLLPFAAPYALMQAGLILYMRAMWIVAPQFLLPLASREVARRIASEPAVSRDPLPAKPYSAPARAASWPAASSARRRARRSSHSLTRP